MGDNVQVLFQTFEYDAFVFLLSPASLASSNCQAEMSAAAFRDAPFFVVRTEGPVPPEFANRVTLTLPALHDSAFGIKLGELAAALRARVSLVRDMKLLRADAVVYDAREAAQRIAVDGERTVLAEYASKLAKRYAAVTDSITQYWIVLALGKAATVESVHLLRGLGKPEHRLVSEGIREALAIAGKEDSQIGVERK